MRSKECTLVVKGACSGKCLLGEIFDHQSQTGRLKSPGGAPGGPYWEEGLWDSLVENTSSDAQNGCTCAQELLKHIEAVDKEKRAKGEIF